MIAMYAPLMPGYNISVDLSLCQMRNLEIDQFFRFLGLFDFSGRTITVVRNKETDLSFPRMKIDTLVWKDSNLFNFSVQDSAGALEFEEMRFENCSYIAGWSKELYCFPLLRRLSYEDSPLFLEQLDCAGLESLESI